MEKFERLSLVCSEDSATHWAAFEISMHRGDLESAKRHFSTSRTCTPMHCRIALAQARLAVESGNPAH
jgi:hypothetical protein